MEPNSTITGRCRGCATPLMYALAVEAQGAPEIHPPFGAVAYKDGHLCPGCTRVVEAALTERAKGGTFTLLHRHREGHATVYTPVRSWNAVDLGIAVEDAILWLNSHLAGDLRRDDEEPGRETTLISGGECVLKFTRGTRAVFIVRRDA